MAELMGGDVDGVIGFDAVSADSAASRKRSSSVVVVVGEGAVGGASTMEVLYGDSSQFQVVMKQLGKRDTTTKLKVRADYILLLGREIT